MQGAPEFISVEAVSVEPVSVMRYNPHILNINNFYKLMSYKNQIWKQMITGRYPTKIPKRPPTNVAPRKINRGPDPTVINDKLSKLLSKTPQPENDRIKNMESQIDEMQFYLKEMSIQIDNLTQSYQKMHSAIGQLSRDLTMARNKMIR